MLKVLLLVGLLITPARSVEHQGAIEAVLRSLRAERPESALYLENRPLKHFKGGAGDALMHDPQWVQEMQRKGLIVGWCTPPEHTLGCTPPDSLHGPPHYSAGFRPLEHTCDDEVAVTVTLTLPPIRDGVANLEKREYGLERNGEGEWQVVSFEVVGVT